MRIRYVLPFGGPNENLVPDSATLILTELRGKRRDCDGIPPDPLYKIRTYGEVLYPTSHDRQRLDQLGWPLPDMRGIDRDCVTPTIEIPRLPSY